MRERIKKIIIDYQKNKKEAIGLEIHYQLSNDNCQLPIVSAEPRDFINFMDFINFRLI